MRLIELSRGLRAVVDDKDYDLVSRYRWFSKKSKNGVWYAQANVKKENGSRSTIFMHRLIMGFPDGKQVDHRNHDGLDNQRRNLRVCDRRENCVNRRANEGRRYKGVSFSEGRWRAYIKVNGKTRSIGAFKSAEEAAKAYDAEAARYFGRFAYLNRPQG